MAAGVVGPDTMAGRDVPGHDGGTSRHRQDAACLRVVDPLRGDVERAFVFLNFLQQVDNLLGFSAFRRSLGRCGAFVRFGRERIEGVGRFRVDRLVVRRLLIIRRGFFAEGVEGINRLLVIGLGIVRRFLVVRWLFTEGVERIDGLLVVGLGVIGGFLLIGRLLFAERIVERLVDFAVLWRVVGLAAERIFKWLVDFAPLGRISRFVFAAGGCGGEFLFECRDFRFGFGKFFLRSVPLSLSFHRVGCGGSGVGVGFGQSVRGFSGFVFGRRQLSVCGCQVFFRLG